MKNWYKPGPVRISYMEPDKCPKKQGKKRDWKTDSDVMGYQAQNIEKIRKRLEHARKK